jgi:hypothetical protein
MKRIMAVAVVGGLLLSVAGCTKTVYVTTTDAPVVTDAPAELRNGFTVNGYTIERGADLRGANLARVNLAYANLVRADLTDADLYDANLTGAHLFDAYLFGAKLPDGWRDIVGAY